MSLINSLLPNKRNFAKIESTIKEALIGSRIKNKAINKQDALRALINLVGNIEKVSWTDDNKMDCTLAIDYNSLDMLKQEIKKTFSMTSSTPFSSASHGANTNMYKAIQLLFELKNHNSITGVFFQSGYPRTFVKALYSLFIMDVKSNDMHVMLTTASINTLHARFIDWVQKDLGLDSTRINLEYIGDCKLRYIESNPIPGFLPTLEDTFLCLSFDGDKSKLRFNFKHSAETLLPLHGYMDSFIDGPDFSHIIVDRATLEPESKKEVNKSSSTSDIISPITDEVEDERERDLSTDLQTTGKNFYYKFNLGNTELKVEEHIAFSKGRGQFIRMSGKPADYPKQLIKCSEAAIGDIRGDTYSMLCQMTEIGAISYAEDDINSKLYWKNLKQLCKIFHELDIAWNIKKDALAEKDNSNMLFTLTTIENSNLSEEVRDFFEANYTFLSKFIGPQKLISINSLKKILVNRFKQNLKFFSVNPNVRIIWIGDIFKGYVYNDALVLELLNFLNVNKCNYEIMLPTQDLIEFIDNVKGIPRNTYDQDYQKNYLENNLCFSASEVDNCLEKLQHCYFDKLRACTKSQDGVTLYTHGIVNNKHLAKLSSSKDVFEINNQFKKLLDNCTEDGYRSIRVDSSPWYPLAFENELSIAGENELQLPKGITKLVHGLTEEYLHKMLQQYQGKIVESIAKYSINITEDLVETLEIIEKLGDLQGQSTYKRQVRLFSYFYTEANLINLKSLLEVVREGIPCQEQLKNDGRSETQIKTAQDEKSILNKCLQQVNYAIKNPNCYLSINYNHSSQDNDEYSKRNLAIYYLPA